MIVITPMIMLHYMVKERLYWVGLTKSGENLKSAFSLADGRKEVT